VVSAAESSTSGQFVFPAIRRGFYVVELLSDSGKVLAVGPGIRVEGGETVSTLVRLPSRRSGYGALFSNTAAGVIAVASSVGVTALGTGTQSSPATVSTQQSRPISPQLKCTSADVRGPGPSRRVRADPGRSVASCAGKLAACSSARSPDGGFQTPTPRGRGIC